MTVADPSEAARRVAPHAAGGDGAPVEPGTRPVHHVRLAVGAVLRSGRPGPGVDGRIAAPVVRGLRRLAAPAGRRNLPGLFGHRLAAMKRSPLHRRTPLKSGGQLRRTGRVYSDRRLAELPDERARRREAIRIAGERDGWRCVAERLVVDVACDGGLDAHEPLTRARGGDPLNPDHIELICRAHHEWTHAHPYEAGQLDLLRHSWEGPIQR